jgi:hypothetical protein
MFNHKETAWFILFETILSSFSIYQLSSAIMTKAKEIDFNQIEIKIETVKRIESDVKEIRVKIEEKPKIAQRKKVIENQIISVEEDDVDIIWFNEN